LLSVSAFKPMIDKILTEAGFATGPDALTSLTNALAAKQLAAGVEAPEAPADSATPTGKPRGGGKDGEPR
jgi:flotillin